MAQHRKFSVATRSPGCSLVDRARHSTIFRRPSAIVLSVDEKTSIQALERTQLPLPLWQGRAARRTHDYKRHGVLDLYADLNVATGEVAHACSDSHTAADFLGFMKLVANENPRRELHVVLDNSSTHGTPEVVAWLKKNPRIRFHYTPTSASWHIASYIASWNKDPTPFIWTKPAAAIIRSHRRMVARIS